MRLLSFQHTLSIIALKTWKQHSIHQFWKDSEDLDFGYIDVRGRIFRMTSNTTTQNQKFERYLPNSGPFQNFYKSNEFALVNQYRENHEQSLLFKNERRKLLKHNDIFLILYYLNRLVPLTQSFHQEHQDHLIRQKLQLNLYKV